MQAFRFCFSIHSADVGNSWIHIRHNSLSNSHKWWSNTKCHSQLVIHRQLSNIYIRKCKEREKDLSRHLYKHKIRFYNLFYTRGNSLRDFCWSVQSKNWAWWNRQFWSGLFSSWFFSSHSSSSFQMHHTQFE